MKKTNEFQNNLIAEIIEWRKIFSIADTVYYSIWEMILDWKLDYVLTIRK